MRNWENFDLVLAMACFGIIAIAGIIAFALWATAR